MALIRCQECGNEISNAAKFCPNCGFGLEGKGPSTTTQIVRFVLLGLIGLLLFFVLAKYFSFWPFKSEITSFQNLFGA